MRCYLTYVMVTEVDASLDSELAAAFRVGGLRAQEEALKALFPRPGEEDERFYREASEDGVLAENTIVLWEVSGAGGWGRRLRR